MRFFVNLFCITREDVLSLLRRLTRDMKIGIGILLVSGALLWWFNLSPPARACFARGGTTFDLDGSCLRVTVEKRQ